ncbi:MAG: hypothetical protein LUE27_01285 [Clostridia bacterium]|nr:hypothetical protein [Clostridia bacterium]
MQDPAPTANSILISIRPEYLRAVLNGTKACEHRHTAPKKPASRETSPAKRVAGEAEITEILELSVQKLWEKTKDIGGLSEAAYLQYFHGRTTGYAIMLGKVTAYMEPVPLESLGVARIPQSWMYLGAPADCKVYIAISR